MMSQKSKKLTIIWEPEWSSIFQNLSNSFDSLFLYLIGFNITQIKMLSHPIERTNQSQTNHCVVRISVKTNNEIKNTSH